MAEVVIISLTKSILEQLSSPLLKKSRLLWNSKKELKKLVSSIETISHVLQDSEKKQLTDQLVKGWLVRLREVMYEADDLFDSLSSIAFRKKTMDENAFIKEVRDFFSGSNHLVVIFRISHEVKAIRESLDDISKDMDQFGFIKQQIVERPIRYLRREPTHSFIQVKDVIGRDKDRDNIVNMLLTEDVGEISFHQCFTVVAIVGFGGFGKTTLAQLVYNDERVRSCFDLSIWVCINYFSDLEKVLKDMIASTGTEPQNIGLDPLQKKLREIINSKKFLIVLDDVWDDSRDNWQKLKTLLDCGKNGSKLLVTTRSREVARCLDAVKSCLRLEALDVESARSLLVKMAFDNEEEPTNKYPKLVPLVQQIVHKCGYVPLALKVVGSLLRHKEKDERIWSQFANDELRDVISDDYDKNVMQILRVSYNSLPPNVKLCFAYCSVFPKDYTFDKDVLVHLWLAQGFIKPCANNSQSLEEMGETYFFYLVDRCFFQDVNDDFQSFLGGYIGIDHCKYTAKVHDLLHDLAIDIVGSETIFVDEVPKQRLSNFRHMTISSDLDCSLDYNGLVSNPKMLRTLMFLFQQRLSRSTISAVLGSFRMLRSLKLACMGVDYIPESIGDLIHLRYLDMSNNPDLKALPSSVCKLHHLITLVLRGCLSLEKLPSKIGQLVSLRHMYVHKCHKLTYLPSGLAALTSLVNLDRVIVHLHNGGLRYLKHLDSLCGGVLIELPVEGWSNAVEDAKDSNMSRKHKLSEMTIKWKRRSNTHTQKIGKVEAKAVLEGLQPHDKLEYLKVFGYGGDVFPSWVCSLQNVKELTLCGCAVEYIEHEVTHFSLFPSLEILEVKEMPNLKGWWREVRLEDDDQLSRLSSLPNVAKLHIEQCPNLKGRMPSFPKIEHLFLHDVDVELVEFLTCSFSLSPYHSNSKLKVLLLIGIGGLCTIPEGWIRHLTCLQELLVSWCCRLQVSCRGLAYLTTLEKLEFNLCDTISLVDEDDENMENEVGMPWKALHRLRVLELHAIDPNTRIQEGLQYLTSLEKLSIGIFPHPSTSVYREMEIDNLPSEALGKLCELKISLGSTSHLPKGIEHLHSLKELYIRHCKDLYLSWTTLLFTLQLHSLTISGVNNIITENMVVEGQSQLRELFLYYGTQAKWMHDVPWKTLGSLVYLYITDIRELEQLPDGIQHLTSLRFLDINVCHNLRSLSNWMRNLTSLRHLRIGSCSEELKQRCQEGNGEDWHLICHIPRRDIRTSADFREADLKLRREEGYCSAIQTNEETTHKNGWCGLSLTK